MNEINGHDLSKDKVNLETSQIPWKELQRFFAAGMVVYVAKELDLVDVAYQFSKDNKTQVEQWLQSQQVAMVSDQQALAWWDEDAVVWAVVVKPWLLVQL
jgi:hypothetical protein